VSAAAHDELPEHLRPVYRRAKVLEWVTIAYMLTAVVVVFLTLGQSQAMKAAWIEDILSLFPPAAFLIAGRIRRRRPNRDFPWGYHRAVSIAYLTAAFALLLLGVYVLGDSLMKLVKAEHPPIGLVEVFGQEVWLGWLMLGALAYTGIPPVILGRMKLPLARDMHDKVLYADAEMNRADWMTAGAAAIGVIGIGFGLWWADAVAASFIALDIVRDGARNIRRATYDLMDARPTHYDGKGPHPLPEVMEAELRRLDWVKDVSVRLREEGHVFAGEALVVPEDEENLVERLEEAADRVLALDWRLHDVSAVPVSEIEREGPTEKADQPQARAEA
jgi:divalent metal cation (Fe/Co/Zn/Cd) transporter